MQRIIPTEYVLTSAAIAEMQQCDAEWLRLRDLRDQSGRQHGAEWTAMGNRAAQLQAVLLDDVASDWPPAFIVKATDAGEWQALPLPPGYWADVVPASAALVKGAVVAGKLHHSDIRRFEGDALCFRRSDWSAWLAVATAKLERWTAPQAAIWIRTRDRAAVRGLDDRERKCLVLAAMAIEDDIEGAGALAASECLRVALQRGRLSATGRRAQLEWVDDTDEPQTWILETDDERIPEEFWKAGNFLPSIGDEGDSAAVPGERERWLRVTVPADDCIRLWPHPSSFLTREPMPIGAAVADLMTEPAERLGWLLIRPDVTLTCLNAAGERVPMDRGIFQTSNFTVDSATNSVSADGLRWVSVMVGLAPVSAEMPVGETPTPQQPAPAASGQKARATQAEHDKWFIQYRDACIAAGKSPNVNEDESEGRAALGGRYHRDRARDSRARLAPDEWRSTGKRKGNEVSQL